VARPSEILYVSDNVNNKLEGMMMMSVIPILKTVSFPGAGIASGYGLYDRDLIPGKVFLSSGYRGLVPLR
jgi:hypothetical protein